MVYICKIPSPAGLLILSSNGKSITGLWIEGQKYYGSTLDRNMLERIDGGVWKLKESERVPGLYEEKAELPVFDEARTWLDAYFKGKEPGFLPSLEPQGSAFRQMVWKILCEIPYGRSTTYGEIARKVAELLGRPTMSAQAVGGAVGHNPISIMIPCHRVMGADGSLTGYAAGMDVKKMLLELEGRRGE